MKRLLIFLGILLTTVALLVGCGGNGEDDFSVELAVTQTLEAINQQSQPALAQTSAGEPALEDIPQEETGLPAQYPAQEACEQMAGLAAEYLNIPVSISLQTFDEDAGLKGEGCTVLAATDGSIANVWGSRTTSLIGQIESGDWISDPYFIGAGIGGMSKIYHKSNLVCVYVHQTGPADSSLCNQDEPIWDCMNRLPPEDKEYKVVIDCTPDQQTNLSGMGPNFSDEGIRLTFEVGTTSQILPGDLSSKGVARFVLAGSEGQTMTVTLASDPENSGVLSVWGEDGTIYLSGTEGLMVWEEVLPETQDYIVDIKNISDEDMTYQLTIQIPQSD